MWICLVILILAGSLFVQISTLNRYEARNYMNFQPLKSLNFVKKFLIKNPILCATNEEKERETYFATLVHDLKTPAFAQIRMLKLLLDGHFGNLTQMQIKVIKETLNSEKYMAEIVSDILTAYKCDYSNFKLKISAFDIANTLNEIYETLKTAAEEKHQKINISYNCSELFIFADKLQITRVMTNLISNAVKYGFCDTEINITLTVNDNFTEFVVKGKSNPIPADKLEKIFEKFSGSQSTYYNNASTGLGLYLSKKIIDLHGGKIYAKSSENGLCTFGFILRTRKTAQNKFKIKPLSKDMI